jgi:hypothetical protein
METGLFYYVRRVDADHIRVSEGSVAARRAEVIDLTSTAAAPHEFTLPAESLGIEVTPKLEATNSESAGVELSDAEQPWPDVILTAPTPSESRLAGLAGGQDLIRDVRSQFAAKEQLMMMAHPRRSPPKPSRESLSACGRPVRKFLQETFDVM